MKLLTIVGARPQFIKAAALSRIVRDSCGISEDILHTGQHYDANMSDVFFEEMDIPRPAINLGISGSGHGAMTGQMLAGIEQAILDRKPDIVLTYGDTNSTLAGGLAASKLHVPVAHVEAGLRSFNMRMPEEINRVLTDRISRWLFCPTETAMQNLRNEGYAVFGASMLNVGDIMLDAALYYSRVNEGRTGKILLPKNDFLLATIHRAENTDDPQLLLSIFNQLLHIHHNVCRVVVPLHPRTRSRLAKLDFDLEDMAVEPVGYMDMVTLTKNAQVVITDSGGLQKEAYFFKRPCVIVRDETEWTELVECGAARISPPNNASIKADTLYYLYNKLDFFSQELYGNGTAAEQIVHLLSSTA